MVTCIQDIPRRASLLGSVQARRRAERGGMPWRSSIPTNTSSNRGRSGWITSIPRCARTRSASRTTRSGRRASAAWRGQPIGIAEVQNPARRRDRRSASAPPPGSAAARALRRGPAARLLGSRRASREARRPRRRRGGSLPELRAPLGAEARLVVDRASREHDGVEPVVHERRAGGPRPAASRRAPHAARSRLARSGASLALAEVCGSR